MSRKKFEYDLREGLPPNYQLQSGDIIGDEEGTWKVAACGICGYLIKLGIHDRTRGSVCQECMESYKKQK